jgi:diguanylate cyclase (GGDEF)-like protein/PAS domain S-box-containing protein
MTSRSASLGRDALSATSCSIVVTDATLPDNPIVYVNPAFSALCGYPIDEIIGRNPRFLQGPDSDPLVRADLHAAVASGAGIRREILNYRKDGTSFWNDLRIDPIHDTTGQLTGFIGIQYEADATHRANEEKAEAESKLAIIADRVPGYIYQRVMRFDGSVETTYVSPSISKLLGIEGSEAARNFFNFVHPDDRDGVLAAIRRSAADMSIFREEFRLVSASGSVHWMRSDAPPRRMPNGDIIWDGLATEIAAAKRWESEIANLAFRDPLTGLLMRSAWRQALTRLLSAASQIQAQCGVLHVDITEFHDLNDRIGQHASDEILCETARRLTRIAESVVGVAGRIGGDEFALLVPDCADKGALSSLVKSVSDALGLPIVIGAQQLKIQTRIGASLGGGGAPDTPDTPDTPAGADLTAELMTQAELALRWAKQQGRNAHMLYSAERDDRFQNRAILARTLEQAIANGELSLHYQPLVEIASGRIVSAEALVRWYHPLLGMQRPDLFIPLAESSGLIVPLGRWVLDEALRQRGRWQREGLLPPPIAINLSGIQLLDPSFISTVETSLRNADADAGDFEIELTEGLLIEPSPQVMASLAGLRRMGFTITIDDFGSGHASFRYLRDFPIDKLKIDQSFVRQLVLESTEALIIRAIISLARGMGIGCVAEGIETEIQRDFLMREGCETGQGALFSMPLVAEDFGWLLANGKRLLQRI